MLVLILMHFLVNIYLALRVHFVSLLELNVLQCQFPPRHFCQPLHLLLSDHDLMFEDVLSFPLQSRYLSLHLSPNRCFLLLELCHLVLELITVYAFCCLTDDLTEETTYCNQCMVAVMDIHAYCFDTANTWLSTHFAFSNFYFVHTRAEYLGAYWANL